MVIKKLLSRIKGEKKCPQNIESSAAVIEQAVSSHSIATSNNIQQPTQPVQTVPDTFNRTDKYGLLSMNPQNSHFNDTESNENYLLDIVAVHGITGDAYDTWTHKNGKLWLRDFVPEDFPGARVFSFG